MTNPIQIPSFYDMDFIKKDGKLSTPAKLYHDNLNQYLTNNLSNNGYVTPNKTTTEITNLQSSVSVGTIWFNTTLAKLQVKTADGVIQTITSS